MINLLSTLKRLVNSNLLIVTKKNRNYYFDRNMRQNLISKTQESNSKFQETRTHSQEQGHTE
jgi:hypothetical protein